MNLSKIAIAGCFVLAFAGVAAAEEIHVDAGSNQNIVVRSDDSIQRRHHEMRVHEDHDRDYIRRHRHDHDHHTPQVDIDINR